MSTLRRAAATGRIILFQKADCALCLLHPPPKATLMYALCPLHLAFYSKSLWGEPARTSSFFFLLFNKIPPMHYMDEFFFSFFLFFIGRVHASCCVVTCYLWTEARRHERKEMGLVSLTKKREVGPLYHPPCHSGGAA